MRTYYLSVTGWKIPESLSIHQGNQGRNDYHNKWEEVEESGHVKCSQNLVNHVEDHIYNWSFPESDSEWSQLAPFIPIIIKFSLSAEFEISTLFAGGVGDDERFLDEIFVEHFFKAFVLQWVVNVVIKIDDNSQRDKIENNVNRVISSTDNTEVCKHYTNALHRLQESTHEGESVVVEFVAVVDGEFHHIKPGAHLVNAWQMQNSSANESRKHDINFDITNNDLRVVAVGLQLDKRHNNKSVLQHKSQDYMHCNVDSFVLPYFESSLEFESLFLFNYV